jgi:hypothetical protein
MTKTTPKMIALDDAALDTVSGGLKMEDETTKGFLLEVSGFTVTDDLTNMKVEQQDKDGMRVDKNRK